MSRSIWLALVLAAMSAAPAAADVLSPGAKWVSHTVRFDNLAEFADYYFYVAAPPQREMRAHVKEKDPDGVELDLRPLAANAETSLNGNPIEGPKWLFAVPRKLQPDPMSKPRFVWFSDSHPEVLKVQLMSGRRSVPVSEKRDKFVTIYHVDIKEGKMTATIVLDDLPGTDVPHEDRGLTRPLIAGAIAIAVLAV